MGLNYKEIMERFESEKGPLTYRQLVHENISFYQLSKLVERGDLVNEAKGLYTLPDTYLDEWFLYQYRFPKGVFSLDTALWLLGLTLTVPFEATMSFPYGTNTKRMKEEQLKPIILRSHFDQGIIELERQPGQSIRLYEAERTLVECLRPVYQMDIQLVAPAFKQYFQNGWVDYTKLSFYGKLFKVEEKLQSYLEVLG